MYPRLCARVRCSLASMSEVDDLAGCGSSPGGMMASTITRAGAGVRGARDVAQDAPTVFVVPIVKNEGEDVYVSRRDGSRRSRPHRLDTVGETVVSESFSAAKHDLGLVEDDSRVGRARWARRRTIMEPSAPPMSATTLPSGSRYPSNMPPRSAVVDPCKRLVLDLDPFQALRRSTRRTFSRRVPRPRFCRSARCPGGGRTERSASPPSRAPVVSGVAALREGCAEFGHLDLVCVGAVQPQGG